MHVAVVQTLDVRDVVDRGVGNYDWHIMHCFACRKIASEAETPEEVILELT